LRLESLENGGFKKMKKELLKMSAELTINQTEESLNNQIHDMVEKIENLLKKVKSIEQSDNDIADKASNILSNTQWAVANLNVDSIIKYVSSYNTAKARLEAIQQYEDVE
jgi:hypothetical protein